MILNHLDKLFITNDAATILHELEVRTVPFTATGELCLQVQHPAAKMLVLACQQQEREVGDGTNFVMIFAGKLLEKAEVLLRMVRCARRTGLAQRGRVCRRRRW